MTGMFGGKLASDPGTDLGQEQQVSCQTCPSLSVLIAPLILSRKQLGAFFFSPKAGGKGGLGGFYSNRSIYFFKKSSRFFVRRDKQTPQDPPSPFF
jgi:hypothetical protein